MDHVSECDVARFWLVNANTTMLSLPVIDWAQISQIKVDREWDKGKISCDAIWFCRVANCNGFQKSWYSRPHSPGIRARIGSIVCSVMNRWYGPVFKADHEFHLKGFVDMLDWLWQHSSHAGSFWIGLKICRWHGHTESMHLRIHNRLYDHVFWAEIMQWINVVRLLSKTIVQQWAIGPPQTHGLTKVMRFFRAFENYRPGFWICGPFKS
jgi:hypothetical protein